MSITDVFQICIVLFLLFGLFYRLAQGGATPATQENTKPQQKPQDEATAGKEKANARVEPDIGPIYATDLTAQQPRQARMIHPELALSKAIGRMARRIPSQDKLVRLQRRRAARIAANKPVQPKVIGR